MTDQKGKTLEIKPDDIPFGSNGLGAPTYFADYIRGTMVSAGVIKLNFVENRFDALASDVKSVHVVTIITPLHQIRAWAKYMTEIADQNGLPEIIPEVVGPRG